MSRHFLLHWHDSRIHYLHILYMYYFYREQLCNQQSDHNDSKNHYFNALNWLPNGQLFFALLSIWMIKVCITVTGFWKTVICPKVQSPKGGKSVQVQLIYVWGLKNGDLQTLLWTETFFILDSKCYLDLRGNSKRITQQPQRAIHAYQFYVDFYT